MAPPELPRRPQDCSRRELYDLGAQTPMIELAKTFGMSNVGLAKHFRKRQIPLPPPKYWNKIRAGQRPKMPPFVEDADLPRPAASPRKPKPVKAKWDLDQQILHWQVAAEARARDAARRREQTKYRFTVSGWQWQFTLGAPGAAYNPNLRHDDEVEQFRDFDLTGILTSPHKPAGQSVVLNLSVVPRGMFANFRDTDRAHVGFLEFMPESVSARASINDHVASDLLQLLVAKLPVEAVLTTEPDDNPEEIIVKVELAMPGS